MPRTIQKCLATAKNTGSCWSKLPGLFQYLPNWFHWVFPLPLFNRIFLEEQYILLTTVIFYNSFIEMYFKYHVIHLTCTMQWFLVYSQSCATIIIINFRTFSSPKKRNLIPFSYHTSAPPTVYLLSLRQPLFYFLSL